MVRAVVLSRAGAVAAGALAALGLMFVTALTAGHLATGRWGEFPLPAVGSTIWTVAWSLVARRLWRVAEANRPTKRVMLRRWHQVAPGRERFDPAGYQRAITTPFFAFVALVSIPGLFDPGKGGAVGRVLAIGLVLAGGIFAVRAARSAVVIATGDGLEYRSLARTRSWPWSAIESFEADDTAVGALAWNRRVLYLREQSGRVRKLEEINARASTSPNPVDDVAERLNTLLAALSGPNPQFPGPGEPPRAHGPAKAPPRRSE